MNLKILTEEKGKLLDEYGEAVNADEKVWSKAKCDGIFQKIQKKDAEIKLVEQENEDLSRSLGGGGPVHEMRSLETGKIISSGRSGDLEQYVSDIIKVELGYSGVQNRDVLGGSTSGQYLVPELLRGPLISYIIERSLLGRLGVKNVAVETDTTKYAQVSALPTADVIAEGAELTETDATYTPQTLQMYSFRSGTIISQELEMDSIANPQNVIEPFAQSVADHIDNMFINGSGSGEPLGLDNQTGTFMRLHLGANGAALTGYEELGAMVRKSRELNHNISAFVMAPRTYVEYKLLETATEEIPKPNPFADIPLVETNQVGIADTQETSSNATKIFCGDYKKSVWAGWRFGGPESLRFLVDRSTLAHFGKIRIYAYVRMGLAHPYGTGVFGWVQGVIPPSGAIT